MSATYLDSILEFHRARVAQDKRDWTARTRFHQERPSLRQAVLEHRSLGLGVIAEVKRRSPSLGWIDQTLDAVNVARAYEAGGACAVSVLTDGPHFGGSLDDLRSVSSCTALPVLRKDFLLSENDLLDARDAGAGAALLIVAALSHEELVRFINVASQVNLDVLVEVHTTEEARRAVDAGALLIGVNQRDLVTFEVDAQRAESVVAVLPGSVVAVAESGFSQPPAARRAAEVGFDAILVGEHLVRSTAPSDAIAAFTGAPIGVRVP